MFNTRFEKSTQTLLRNFSVPVEYKSPAANQRKQRKTSIALSGDG